jgi:predicted ATPase/Tfp pilus assembly protein PilF
MQQFSADLFNYKSLRRALKSWHDLKELGRHPLAALAQIGGEAEAAPGLALRGLLRRAVEEMRPGGEAPDFAHRRWRYYTILKEQYLNGRHAGELRDELGVSESGYFADQRQALERLGNWLRELAACLPQTAAPAVRPAPVEPAAPPLRLPQQLTPFIGRRQERGQIGDLLAQPDCRLVSLVGPGGMGKSRLSIQVGYDQARQFRHGVFFVPLAALEQAAYIVTAVANNVGLDFDSQTDRQEQLLNFLRHKELLLILDNFEHLLDNAAVVQAILEQAPAVKIIITSRERLNLRGEWIIPISGMSFPEEPPLAEGQPLLNDLKEYSAIQLFLGAAERQTGRPLPASEWPHLVRICQLVQGMPLGIELAASWVQLIPCAEIVVEIERNLDFLESAFRDLPERHQSLRAVFNHSWSLLSQEEQVAFCRLSVFWGGFSREAAREVAEATLPVLQTLSNKSLLARRPSGRYTVHALLRQYAAERLNDWPELRQLTQRRHSLFFLRLLTTEAADLRQGGRQQESLRRLQKGLEDIRLAWRWAVDNDYNDLLRQTAESLFLLYLMLNQLQEGEETFAYLAVRQRQSAQPDDPAILALALAFQGRFKLLLGRVSQGQALCRHSLRLLAGGDWPREAAMVSMLALEANLSEAGMQPEQLYETAVAYYTAWDDAWGLATTHFNLVSHYRTAAGLHNYDKQQRLLQASRRIYQQIGDQWGLAKCLNNLALIAYERGSYIEAEQYARQGLQLHRELDNRLGVAYSLNNLAQTMSSQGDYAQARQFYEESLAIFESFGDRREIAICLDCIGYVNYLMGDIAEAQRYYEESLLICQEMDDPQGIAWSFHNLGDIAHAQGDLSKAQAYYQQSHEIHRQKEPLDWGRVVALIKLGRTTLALGNQAEAMTLLQEGLRLAVQTERFREAMDALYSMAQIFWYWERREEALTCLALVKGRPATAKETRTAAERDWAAWREAATGEMVAAVLRRAEGLSIIEWAELF